MSIYDRKNKFHFIGIGGVGMSGLADIIVEMGHQVSGSDRQLSALTDYLKNRGVSIYEGHSEAHVRDTDFVIYSSAIPADNPEMYKARQQGIPCIRRADLLGQLMLRKIGVAVAGTHGKTTTTSMIGEVLIHAGVDPTVVVGGRMQNSMTNARLGKGEVMVTEADEYDRSFLTLFPRIAVITSLETDHLDIYRDMNDLSETFIKFANQTSFDGTVIYCADDPNLRAIHPKIGRLNLSYGMEHDADFQCSDVRFEHEISRFSITRDKKKIGEIELRVPGRHNVLNAMAAAVACHELDIPFRTIKSGLESFAGVERRFELKASKNGILFFDDYAHHPSEVRATLQAARQGWNSRIIAVFQPHLYSRTKDFYKEFANELAEADQVIVTGIYPAREEPIKGVSSKLIVDELERKNYSAVFYIEDKAELPRFISKQATDGDLVITMGAGDIWMYGEQAIELID